jgi:hypothetical protein
MCVTAICGYGYEVAHCGCLQQYDPVAVVDCTHAPGHPDGRLYPRRVEAFRSAGLAEQLEMQSCPRCDVDQMIGDFRGGVCGWCADDLERQHVG